MGIPGRFVLALRRTPPRTSPFSDCSVAPTRSSHAPQVVEAPLHITPVSFFADEDFPVHAKLCFVVMPFTEAWSARTYRVIKEVVESLGYECRRADDFYGKVVLHDIWDKLNRAAFIVADLTSANPNVYYELGLAHALGKEIVPMLQDGHTIPFDQQPFRVLFYQDNSDGEALLRSRLPGWIEALDYSSSPEMMLRRGSVAQFNSWRRERRHVHLTRRSLVGCAIDGVDFSRVFLSETDLAESQLCNATATASIMIRADLSDAVCDGTDFREANLSESRMERASLRGCDLRAAILIRAALADADFTGAQLAGTTIDEATHARFARELSMGIDYDKMVIERA